LPVTLALPFRVKVQVFLVPSASFYLTEAATRVRRVRWAAAVVPELYEGQSPHLPGWAERVDRQER
jgi:hypothetical protein